MTGPSRLPGFVHGLTRDELAAACARLGEPSYRSDQVWNWLYVQHADDWARFTNIPASLRRGLAERYEIRPVTLLAAEGEHGQTQKLLAGLHDGRAVEEVLIPAAHGADKQGRRFTVCLSSQVGCRFRCAFCASGTRGLERNLEPGEMVGEFLLGLQQAGEHPLTHVVFMGIGEPLDNYDAVLKAIRILNDPGGIAIGARRITISTCGLVPGIERLAGEGLQVELSVSLHAGQESVRSRLMPVNRIHSLSRLLDACRQYTAATKRIITFEYALIDGVNDQAHQARDLVDRLRPIPCRVNLIPLSPVAEFHGRPSPPEAAARFLDTLNAAGIHATMRDSRGSAIRAACGQLRARHRGKGEA